mmetsp:Transcript_46086/g.99509  ORF Transcript_46086/g.99509 Transcript_46086/m.99509 type:complete len:197 (-) Transcript_46086:141-731(-)
MAIGFLAAVSDGGSYELGGSVGSSVGYVCQSAPSASHQHHEGTSFECWNGCAMPDPLPIPASGDQPMSTGQGGSASAYGSANGSSNDASLMNQAGTSGQLAGIDLEWFKNNADGIPKPRMFTLQASGRPEDSGLTPDPGSRDRWGGYEMQQPDSSFGLSISAMPPEVSLLALSSSWTPHFQDPPRIEKATAWARFL